MDDFARGELLWVKRTLEKNWNIGICYALTVSIEAEGSVINYLDCFSELLALWDGCIFRANQIRRIDPDDTQAYKSTFWWSPNQDGQRMRIEAIDFLLTKRQGATYARHPDA